MNKIHTIIKYTNLSEFFAFAPTGLHARRNTKTGKWSSSYTLRKITWNVPSEREK